ncbi:hypothetical protein F4824DRAFT_231576 [Ustulina deusta]|nr:hypothetical protein F4824DRAFT_231576 [Ustulina deusta]
MAFTINTLNSDGNDDPKEGILHNLRHMVERTDPRGSYYIEPTWRINGIPISRCASPDSRRRTSATRPPKFDTLARPRQPTFKQHLREQRSSDLREIIMNFCLRSLDTHKDVVEMLKRMQKKKPRPISLGERVQNPTVGLYLYCRTHRELVDIIIDLARHDETGYFERDVRDLTRVIQEKEENARYF